MGCQLGQNAAEAQPFIAQGWPHPVVSGGRCVALVKYEIDDFQDRRQARSQLGSARYLEWDVGLGEGAFGANDTLGYRGFWNQECARDFVGG